MRIAVLIALVLLPTLAQAQSAPLRRVALVIGNATYTNGGVLDNPESDAEAVAAKLTKLGFQVTADKNLGQSGMRNLIGAFMSKVRDGDLVLIYYAGHGVEADGRDFMLPVDVNLDTPSSVQFQGIALDMLYSDKATFGVIVVFDACRDNPFLRRVKGAVAGTHALSPPAGDLVLFSASSGDVAEDGGGDASGGVRKNSVFATAFLNALSVPDASIQKIYQLTLREVRTLTSGRQAPQRFGDLADDFVFNPTEGPRYASAAPPPPPAPVIAPPPAAVTLAANAAVPAGTVYRSLPTTPAMEIGPQPEPIPVVQPAPDPPPVARDPAPVARVEASAPQPPPAAIQFTIAELGLNIMPPPPQLATVPTITLPASFCSVEDEIAFLKDVFKPAYDVAYRNNEIAIGYLNGLNALGQEYNRVQSGFVFRIKAQFDQFAPISAHANEVSNEILAYDAKVRRVPIVPCAKH